MKLEDVAVGVPRIWDGGKWIPASMFRPVGAAPPPTVLWLEVTVRASSFGSCGEGALYTRSVVFAHLPEEGDMDALELYPGEDGSIGGGPMWGVNRRYWHCTGQCNLELQTMHIDPQGPLLQHFQSRRWDAPSVQRDRVWLTETEEYDPRERLLAAGWVEYTGTQS